MEFYLQRDYVARKPKEALYRHNENNPDRLVRLIDGNDLADLFLQYF